MLEVVNAREVQMFLDARCQLVPESGCWEWALQLDKHGYGKTSYLGKTTYAHRLSYAAHVGRIDGPMCVLHKCDNRKCINPDHLFTGTPADNAQDMMSKGRQTRGEKNPRAKITSSDADEIRKIRAETGESHRRIASMFGISRVQVGRIIRGARWTVAK